ncbi:hypothetical protein CU097_013212 [Rhizopus azygosporus]|uniref:Protein kinase domain-containing protein n=1 Tax=Rhizopus azygosporus TaxID=86630 RepID=A0A367K3T7_RHIAZ|nr:hypothetical protein CU097_013212 [Rhizopus azygosporus]
MKPRLVLKATLYYVDIVKKINPTFKHELVYIPKRTLTNPREPSKNNGYDNINDDYILRVKEIISSTKESYEILELMGQGTFGQVVQCRELSTNNLVAVKIIKRHRAFTAQGEKEINTLKMLNDHSRYKDKYLQLRDHFVFRGHICLVFELLSVSLHKVLKQKPRLSILDIKLISVRILETLASLADLHIIHTDLKPDNILLKSPDDLHDVKLIDYGSACLETDRPTNYHIQTAFYRSPEVIIKAPYHCAVDMWSFGCFVAELYLEKPLFPSGNEIILLHMMAKTLQSLPPDHMLHKGEKSQKFFHIKGTQSDVTKLREIGAHDISATSLDERITGHPRSDDDTEEDQKWLLDFLKKILVYDPDKRYTPRQALQHPFITSDPVIHSSSSISRTTEESNEIKTPSPPLHKPDAKPLKSILKKKSSKDLKVPLPQLDNTLDSTVALIYQQPRPTTGFINTYPFQSPQHPAMAYYTHYFSH